MTNGHCTIWLFIHSYREVQLSAAVFLNPIFTICSLRMCPQFSQGSYQHNCNNLVASGVKPSTPFYSEPWLTSSSSLCFRWASAFSYSGRQWRGRGRGDSERETTAILLVPQPCLYRDYVIPTSLLVCGIIFHNGRIWYLLHWQYSRCQCNRYHILPLWNIIPQTRSDVGIT